MDGGEGTEAILLAGDGVNVEAAARGRQGVSINRLCL